MILTAEDKTNIFKKLGYGQKAMLDLNLIELIEATEQALLAKLQPEGMVETLLKPHREYVATMEAEFKKASERYEKAKAWDGKEADNGEFLSFRDGLREAKLILKVVENLVTVELSPYLLQAKEEREKFDTELVDILNCIDGGGDYIEAIQALRLRLSRQALSSPATEKEGK